ncbi:MAG TPA: cobalt ECF transporter T component CbiQ, partial [Candidatus Omnitrophota bacterium]|nr:cobalt ECF transporter T component CbiQ [Candidatus Omnitrophota bacterium]
PLVFCLYLASLLLASISKISLSFFLKRTWFFIPIFSLFIALPALFKIFSPGEVIFFSITKQGLFGALLFVLRVLTSVSFSVLIVLTTPHILLLRALRSLGVPSIFVAVFMMCYRYLHILIKTVEEAYLGIKSRLIKNLENRRLRKIIVWRIGVIWEKSSLMAEEVYQAMLSRGYSGEPKSRLAFKLRRIDFCWLAGLLIFCLTILYIDARALI